MTANEQSDSKTLEIQRFEIERKQLEIEVQRNEINKLQIEKASSLGKTGLKGLLIGTIVGYFWILSLVIAAGFLRFTMDGSDITIMTCVMFACVTAYGALVFNRSATILVKPNEFKVDVTKN